MKVQLIVTIEGDWLYNSRKATSADVEKHLRKAAKEEFEFLASSVTVKRHKASTEVAIASIEQAPDAEQGVGMAGQVPVAKIGYLRGHYEAGLDAHLIDGAEIYDGMLLFAAPLPPTAIKEPVESGKPLHRMAKGWQQCPQCDCLHAEIPENSAFVQAHRQAEIAASLANESAGGLESPWISVLERLPDAGELIVKRWKSGSVWAGIYSGSAKDSSFDEWLSISAAPNDSEGEKG